MLGPVEFIVSRAFDAPRSLIWKAWSEQESLAQWWAPRGVTMPTYTFDFSEGGTFHYCFRLPDGQELWGKLLFCQILEPHQITFIHSFADEHGNTIRHPLMPEWPLETTFTVVFSTLESGTELTIKAVPIDANEQENATFREGMDALLQGFTSTLDKLGELLSRIRK